MNKVVKRVLLVILIIAVGIAGLLLYSYYPMMTMHPAETGSIPQTNIYSIKIDINSVYFVQTGAGYIMIDAGTDAAAVQTSLQEAGINAGDVKWILLTHSDYDHVAALTLFDQAQIYMSEEEFKLVNGTEKRSAAGGNTMPEGIDIAGINLLQDGQELMCDETRVECLLAPGHTNGSMVYLLDEKYLFTGDAFKVSKGKTSVHPYSMDNELSKSTMTEKLKDIVNRSTFVLTAHYGYYENFKIE